MSFNQRRGRPMPAEQQMSPDQLARRAKEIDSLSTALINVGVTVVKRHPVPTSLYIIGVLVCLFFGGLTATPEQEAEFTTLLSEIDSSKLEIAEQHYYNSYNEYYRHKGWFSCNEECQYYKLAMETDQQIVADLTRAQHASVSNAKGKVGVFSTYSVEETRDMFWTKFNQGKKMAARSSMWDMMFMGVRRMGRDENMIEFMLRALMSILMNITIGMLMTVITFVFSLYSIIVAYQADFLSGTVFFTAAALAAVSFAVSWLIAIYLGTAGAVYVGAKAIAANMRIEGGRTGGESIRR